MLCTPFPMIDHRVRVPTCRGHTVFSPRPPTPRRGHGGFRRNPQPSVPRPRDPKRPTTRANPTSTSQHPSRSPRVRAYLRAYASRLRPYPHCVVCSAVLSWWPGPAAARWLASRVTPRSAHARRQRHPEMARLEPPGNGRAWHGVGRITRACTLSALHVESLTGILTSRNRTRRCRCGRAACAIGG